jgi:leader peptidase (prepilin peptidase)/N-methyltransferase
VSSHGGALWRRFNPPVTPLLILAGQSAVFVCLAIALGLVVGSFLNVVIHRLPKMLEREWSEQCAEFSGKEIAPQPRYNLAVPRSACPGCGASIAAWQNIPIASWLILGGRCKSCSMPISARYPAVEAISAVAAGYCAWRFGFAPAAVAAMVYVWCMIALSFIDYDTQLLPDDITLPLTWAGLLVNLLPGGFARDLPSAVIGAVAGYLALWSVYWLFKFATGKEGMGYGDFKLLAAIGAWLGWQMLTLVILLSSVVGAVIGIAMIVFAGRGRNKPMPFGPYLAAAGVIAMFWGHELNRAYLGLL